jgi:hypothetical protein
MEKEFRASPEFQKLDFQVVTNKRLADAYAREHFPQELTWRWERYERREARRPGRPGWQVYRDGTLVCTVEGTKNWEQYGFPKIRQIVAEQVAK